MDKRIKDAKKSGMGTDDIPKPNLWWYDMVEFLVKDTGPTSTTCNLDVS